MQGRQIQAAAPAVQGWEALLDQGLQRPQSAFRPPPSFVYEVDLRFAVRAVH